MPDKRFTYEPCECGDGFCAGCEEAMQEEYLQEELAFAVERAEAAAEPDGPRVGA